MHYAYKKFLGRLQLKKLRFLQFFNREGKFKIEKLREKAQPVGPKRVSIVGS